MTAPRLDWGACSEAGRRAENQDHVLADPPVFAVADGMGGHLSGAAASAGAVGALGELAGAPTTVDALRTAIRTADDRIRELSAAGDPQGAGTTVAGLALVDHGGERYWAVFGLGDSRVYGWDGHVLVQLSHDHSVVQELVDAGAIRAQDAAVHPERHVITRALGVGPVCEADFSLLPVRPGHRYLVCSDGVSGALDAGRIAAALAVGSPAAVAEALVARALEAGSTDNASAVVVDVLGAGAEAAPDPGEATVPRVTGTGTDHGGAP